VNFDYDLNMMINSRLDEVFLNHVRVPLPRLIRVLTIVVIKYRYGIFSKPGHVLCNDERHVSKVILVIVHHGFLHLLVGPLDIFWISHQVFSAAKDSDWEI
jgi:hypothetical protein